MKALFITALVLIVSLVAVGFVFERNTTETNLERNKALVKDFLDAYVKVDLDRLDKIVHKEYKQYYFDEYQDNYDGLINSIKQKGQAGDVVLYEFIAEGDKVLVRFTAAYPPAIFNGAEIYKIKDGKVIEGRFFYKQMN